MDSFMVQERPPEPTDSSSPPLLSESWWRSNFAAILVGVIALVSTVGSSLVAYNATELQASSARQQSAEEFRRNEKKDAYNALITTVEKLDEAEIELRPQNLTYPLDTTTGPFFDGTQKWAAADREFQRAAAGVQLAGSLPVREALETLREAHQDVMTAFVQTTSHVNDNDKPGAERSIADFEAKRHGTIKPENEFIRAAKTDLGFTDLPDR